MIVEFVGIPGSGKTTAALRTIDVLRNRGVQCQYDHLWNRRMSFSERIMATASNPGLALLLISATHTKAQLSAANRMLGRDWIAKQLSPNTVLDSGPIHVASLTTRSLPVDPQKLIRRLILPEVVVDMHVPPETAVARALMQGKNRRTMRGDRSEALGRLKIIRQSLNTLLDLANVRTRIVIDGTVDSPDQVAQRVSQLVSTASKHLPNPDLSH